MILLVDIGNSRVKWALFDAGALAPQRAAAYAQWSADDWRRELFTDPGIRHVVVASVAGTESIGRLRAAASARPGCEVQVVTTSSEAGGVRNAYPDPRLLGIDRWLAVIAAHHLTGTACCVVDVGTAATIDAVTADGRHLGGFIVPGPRLMVASLLRGTSDLESHSAASAADGGALFADNTRDAIERGAVVMLAALAERSVQDLERAIGGTSALLLTGGAAPLVLPHLRRDARHVPDLVLRGLAVLAERGL